MPWLLIVIAGLLEVAWAFSLKHSEGFSKPLPSVLTLVLMVASFALLAVAMRSLPLGTAYAVWTGIGALGAFLVGVVLLGEALTPLRAGSAALILMGLVGMKLASEPAPAEPAQVAATEEPRGDRG